MKREKKTDKNTIYLLAALAIAGWFWRCPLRMVGLSCPGCGMTSALLAVLGLDFRTAFYFHPLWPLVVLCAIYLLMRYLGWFRLNETRERKLLVMIVLIFIGVYFYRLLISHSPVVEFTLASLID